MGRGDEIQPITSPDPMVNIHVWCIFMVYIHVYCLSLHWTVSPLRKGSLLSPWNREGPQSIFLKRIKECFGVPGTGGQRPDDSVQVSSDRLCRHCASAPCSGSACVSDV